MRVIRNLRIVTKSTLLVAVLLTLGDEGARYASADEDVTVAAERVEAVDTTGAGDTFIGFFLAGRALGHDVATSMHRATRAAALCVTRPGAAASIPTNDELGDG